MSVKLLSKCFIFDERLFPLMPAHPVWMLESLQQEVNAGDCAGGFDSSYQLAVRAAAVLGQSPLPAITVGPAEVPV